MKLLNTHTLNKVLIILFCAILNLQAQEQDSSSEELAEVSNSHSLQKYHEEHHYKSHDPLHYEKLTNRLRERLRNIATGDDVIALVNEMQFPFPRHAIKLLEESDDILSQLSKQRYVKSQSLLFQLLVKVGEVKKAKQLVKKLWLEFPEPFHSWLHLMDIQIDLAQQLLDQSEQKLKRFHESNLNDNPELNLWYLLIAGNQRLLKSEFDVALSLLFEAQEKARLLNNTSAEITIYDQLAKLFFHTQKYDKALEFSDAMLTKALEVDDRFAEVSANANKMNIYYTMAIQQANRSENLGEQGEINLDYMELLERSDSLAQRVIQQAEAVGAHRARTWARILRQNLLLTRDDYEQAINVAESTIEYAEHHQLEFEAAISYNNMAIAYRNLNNFDASRLALKQAERIYQEMGNKQSQLWLMEDYAKLYELEGNFKQALEYFKQYHQASLELADARNQRTLLELQEEYAANQKQIEIERLNHQMLLDARQLQSERLRGWLLTVIIIALLAIAYVLYFKRQRLQKLLKNEARLNREITELGEAKQRFFVNISHEFRTALTLSISPLRKVTQDPELPEHYNQQLQGALENNLHMLSLINEVMTMEQVRQGQMPVHLGRFSTREAIKQFLRRFQPQFLDKSISVNLALDDGDDSIVFDLAHFEKVIANLISNAVKFSPVGATLHIKTNALSQCVEIIITDEGPGIPEKELPFIFRRFFQGSYSLQQATSGSGIGLSMVYELLKSHGADIEVHSEEQQGCRVKVTIQKGDAHFCDSLRNQIQQQSARTTSFDDDATCNDDNKVISIISRLKPVSFDENVIGAKCNEEHAHRLSPTKTQSQSSFRSSIRTEKFKQGDSNDGGSEYQGVTATEQQTILLVDDHPKVRQLLKDMLQLRFRILEAANGKDALQIARSVQPDLVISDVMMPDMDGFELTRQMRLDKELAHLSIILVTALDDERSKLSGLKLGADDYIAKPFSEEELNTRVINLLQRKQQLSETLLQKIKSRYLVAKASVELNSQASRRKAQLEKVISENLGRWDFDVEQMYTALNMTRSTLFRFTKEAFGCSPKSLLKKRRLELAHSMLLDNQGSISEVAYAVGFQSLSTFSRAFREHYDRAPTEVVKCFKNAR